MLEILDLFVRSPGDFFYHVVVVLAFSGGLAIALGQRAKHPQSRTASHYGASMLGALLGWLILVGGAVYSIFNNQDPLLILPPLERAVHLAVLLIIAWAFITVDHDRWGNMPLFVLLTLLFFVTVGYIATGVQWPLMAETIDFNLSRLGVAWTFIQAMAALIAIVLTVLFFADIIDAPLKFVFFLLLLFGYGGTLWQMANGDIIGNYSGLSRLALFLAVPIVPFVIYRKVIYGYELAFKLQSDEVTRLKSSSKPAARSKAAHTKTTTEADAVPLVSSRPLSKAEISPKSSPVERESVQLLRTIGIILEQSDPADIPLRVVKAAVEVLKADVGALLSVKDANYADIMVAYDRAMQRPIPAMLSLNLEQQVTLSNAIDRRQQRPLFVDRNESELSDLYTRLDVNQLGPAYFQPLMRDDELIAVLVVGLPYASRELRDAERELLKGIGIIAGSLLSLSYAADDAMSRAEERAIQAVLTGVPMDEIDDSDVLAAQQEMQSALDAARDQNQALQKQVAQLKIALDDERSRLTMLVGDSEQGLSVTQRILALNEEHERLRQDREQLARRLQEAETALASASGGGDETMYRTMIETLNREKRLLSAELEALQAQLGEIRQLNDAAVISDDVVQFMDAEKERLQSEHDQMRNQLSDIEAQLVAMGYEGGADDLTDVIRRLHDDRSKLQVQMQALTTERDALRTERQRFSQRIRKEEEREMQIEAMESEIRHLATDREAAIRQRDQMRMERDEMRDKVDKVKEQRARLLADVSVYQQELEEVQQQLQTLTAQIQGHDRVVATLHSELDQLRVDNQTLTHQRDQLIARTEGDRQRLQSLSRDAQAEMRTLVASLTDQRNQLEQELSQTREALRTAQIQQTRLEQQIAQGLMSTTEENFNTNPELLMSMVDGLRTPMTSIMGYIDLLAGESIGILSEQQRKFVQRISANVVRLQTMLNDLSHITALDTGYYKLEMEPANLVEMVEDAITNGTYQFREKDLRLQLELDDTVPDAPMDVDGVGQVIGQLLTNAYLVSPAETDVVVRVEQRHFRPPHQAESGMFAVFSVTDSGGGVDMTDVSEVFARRYRTDHRLLQGIGDTGVGLSIAKALVEAHGGSMWLEIIPDVGTTFSFALPITT